MAARTVAVGWLVLALVAEASGPAGAMDAEETAAVAAAVRDRGYPCMAPVSIQRDEAASGPDEAAWLVDCQDARYRVRFMGDTPAVEPLAR
jgi:hypothetical protein